MVGKVLLRHHRLPSTNEFALQMLGQGDVKEGTVILAAFQTAGRGQMGTTWQSDEGQNLTLSIILKPSFLSAQDQFQLNKAISIGVCQTVQALLLQSTRIKWPNDIYVGDQKVAGILIQNVLQGQTIEAAVVGIGLNVNQVDFDPALPNPTSLAQLSRTTYDLEEVRTTLFAHLDQTYHMLAHEPRRLHDVYQQLLYRRHQRTGFLLDTGQSVQGYIQGVNDHGQLEVMLDGGRKRWFSLKEISLA